MVDPYSVRWRRVTGRVAWLEVHAFRDFIFLRPQRVRKRARSRIERTHADPTGCIHNKTPEVSGTGYIPQKARVGTRARERQVLVTVFGNTVGETLVV